MPNSSHVLPDRTGDGFRARLIAVLSALVVANILAWVWTLAAFAGQPVLVGTAVLAYTLGLRHALDADHIAAIDNVTRKLMQDGQRPVAVGLFFALGHSAVVLIASVAIALAATSLIGRFAAYREIGGVIGTSASALFLFVIAISNLIVLFGLYRAFKRVRRGAALHEDDIDELLQQRGWLARLFRPLFRFVSKSSHLFPIGFLFALCSSRIGRTLVAIKQNEPLVRAQGISPMPYKLAAFAISAGITGAAGGVYCFNLRIIDPTFLDFYYMQTFLIIVIIGGAGSFWGVVAAGVALSALPEVLRFSEDFRMIIYGVILVVAMFVMPGGVSGWLRERRLARLREALR